MNDKHFASAIPGDSFFSRHNLGSKARDECQMFVREHFADKAVRLVSSQGYCSYTLLVGDDWIIQFRPFKHELDLSIASAAKNVFGSFAPSTEYLATLSQSGLIVYQMEQMEGISYKDFVMAGQAEQLGFRQSLCEDLAVFLARSWNHREKISLPVGIIGSSIEDRLRRLSKELPSRFRASAIDVRQNLHLLEKSCVLTHGDFVPSNIMLDPSTGRLSGLVDWTEAEMLPFGTSLYGLEEILGELTEQGFVYYNEAKTCRQAFFRKLCQEMPSSAHEILQSIMVARELGILLWYGFAFDDGAINRVVQEDTDPAEIAFLDAFLEPKLMLDILRWLSVH